MKELDGTQEYQYIPTLIRMHRIYIRIERKQMKIGCESTNMNVSLVVTEAIDAVLGRNGPFSTKMAAYSRHEKKRRKE